MLCTMACRHACTGQRVACGSQLSYCEGLTCQTQVLSLGSKCHTHWATFLASEIFFFKVLFVYFMHVYVPACVYLYHVHAWCLWRPDNHVRSLGIRVIGSCELSLQSSPPRCFLSFFFSLSPLSFQCWCHCILGTLHMNWKCVTMIIPTVDWWS